MITTRIKQAGFEVEGVFDEGIPTVYDGSLSEGMREFVSKPYTTLAGFLDSIEAHWPEEVDASCGFHIHLSFAHVDDYCRLMCDAFCDYFIEEMRKWGKGYPNGGVTNANFWSRLNGEVRWCRLYGEYDYQVEQTGKEYCRYRHWNFCWRIHGTAECRLLPAFVFSKTAVAAAEQVIKLVDDWLSLPVKPLPEAVVEIEDNPIEGMEELICV